MELPQEENKEPEKHSSLSAGGKIYPVFHYSNRALIKPGRVGVFLIVFIEVMSRGDEAFARLNGSSAVTWRCPPLGLFAANVTLGLKAMCNFF